MQKISILLTLLLSFTTGTVLYAQDDLMKQLEEEDKKVKKVDYTTAAFKTTRLVNGHTIENVAPGVLDLKISHRFGFVNQGAYQLFGLDQATMRIGLDYGLSDRLMIGGGRSTYEKQYDAFYKYKILRQTEKGSAHYCPVTLSAISTINVKTLKWVDATRKNYFSSRLAFSHQLLLGRKFNDNVSLQLMPSFVHYNLVPNTTDPNDIFAMGIGGRIKLSKRVSFNGEYYYILPISLTEGETRLPGTHNSLALGFDIETGGHVFQLHFTNSTGMTEKSFIGETVGDFFKGDIHFGFNIARVFTINDRRKKG